MAVKEASLPYAYPCDTYMETILSNVLVRKTLQLVVNRYCKGEIRAIVAESQKVTAKSYPRLYSLVEDCKCTLGIKEKLEVYVTGRLGGINALTIGTDEDPIVLISRKALVSLTDGELKFLIGHELGHVQQKNLVCHTLKGILDEWTDSSEILGKVVADMIDVPLKQWHRCSEYTADRAGIICCKDINIVSSLFNKVSSVSEKEDPTAELFELAQAHPLYGHRIKELKTYIGTDL
jgi:Zn-dependent protease with chaperone function